MAVHRIRRCVLAVPGSNVKMAAKAAALDVDQVMLDLEDAVAPAAKVEARAGVIGSLLTATWNTKIVSVRVNDVRSQWFERDVLDVVEAAGDKIDTIVLPKAEQPSDVRTLALLLGRLERARGFARRIGIEPQIESASGLARSEEIAQAHERVESLTFGPADFAASIGSPALTIGGHRFPYPGHVWHYAMSRIVVAAKAAGLAAIDGPYGAIKDREGLVESAQMAKVLGFDGKWAIHPSQVGPIVETFAPTADELDRARRIADRYGRALSGEGVGAVAFEGELVDAATLRLAERALRNERDRGDR
jgi:citrate lyase subunit beta/citryl-CoA lyase